MLVLRERGIDLHPVEDFDDIIDGIACWPDASIVVLRAFLDASRRDSGVLCVAGFAFGIDRAKKAEREWRAALSGKRCHMTDLHSRRADFAEFTAAQAGDLLKSLVSITRRHYSCAVAVSVDIETADRHLPKRSTDDSKVLLDGFRRPYSACLWFAMSALRKLARAKGTDGIAYIVESGDQYQTEASRFLSHCSSDEAMKEDLLLRSYNVLDKRDSRLLESADVLAWEWARHVERMLEGKPTRPSLSALLDARPDDLMSTNYLNDRCRVFHLTEAVLAKSGPKFEKLFLADSMESIHASLR